MQRIGRRALSILATVSALVCVAICGLRVGAHFRREHLDVRLWTNRPSDDWPGVVFFNEFAGDIYAGGFEPSWADLGGRSHVYWATEADPSLVTAQVHQSLAGQGWETWHHLAVPGARIVVRGSDGHGRPLLGLICRTLWLISLTGALPVLQLLALQRRRRRESIGLCRHCGYDLRATPGRCPECGTAAAI